MVFPLLETSRGKCFRLKVKCEQLITSFRSTASAFNVQQLFLHKCKYGKMCSVCKDPIWFLKLSTRCGNKLCVEKRNSSKEDPFWKGCLAVISHYFWNWIVVCSAVDCQDFIKVKDCRTVLRIYRYTNFQANPCIKEDYGTF